MKNKDFIDNFDAIVRESSRVLITAHISPDDDSISSVLGLYWYVGLKYPGVKSEILYSGEPTEKWSYFENFDKIRFVDDISEYLHEFDCLIVADVSQYKRITNNEQALKNFKGKRICIDHHKGEPDFFDIACIDSSFTAASELLYSLFYEQIEVIPTRICEVILLGLLGDTGGFTYVQPSQSGVFDVAKRMVGEGGVSVQELKARYMQYDYDVFRLMQILMSHFELIEVGEWGKFSISYLDRDECRRITESDFVVSTASTIFVDTYSKAIKGVNWGMVYYPKFSKHEYRASFRSLPQGVNVRLIAQGMGIGGGHDLASGGSFPGAMNARSCMEQVKKWLAENVPALF